MSQTTHPTPDPTSGDGTTLPQRHFAKWLVGEQAPAFWDNFAFDDAAVLGEQAAAYRHAAAALLEAAADLDVEAATGGDDRTSGIPMRVLPVPADAVRIYVCGDRVEARRADHRPPKGMPASTLAALAWRDVAGVATQLRIDGGQPLPATTIAKALASVPPPVTAPVPLYPHQQAAFEELVRLDRATLGAPMGTGGTEVAVAALVHRAIADGADRVHVVCPAPLLRHVSDLLEPLLAGTGIDPVVRIPRRMDETAAAGLTHLLIVNLRLLIRCFRGSATPLTSLTERARVAYATVAADGHGLSVFPALRPGAGLF